MAPLDMISSPINRQSREEHNASSYGLIIIRNAKHGFKPSKYGMCADYWEKEK